MKKRLLSGIITFAMLFTFIPSGIANAASNDNELNTFTTKTEIITVEDETGTPIDVEVTEYIHNISETTPYGLSPTHKIGERKQYSVKITNAQLGFPAIVKGTLTTSQKKKIASIGAKAISKKVGSKFIPGVNLVTSIMTLTGAVNAVAGNTGFVVGCTLEYQKSYMHKEGYYIYGWDPIKAYMKGYK